jgi:hypothetical protein
VPEYVVQYAMYGTQMDEVWQYDRKCANIDFNAYSVLSTNHLGDQIKVDEMG